MRWAGHERPSRSGPGRCQAAPGQMPSDPPLPATTVREGRAYGGTRPLTGRTTVSLDLKGCLEEVSKTAAGAGTQLQRHDHKKEHASRRQQGADRSKTSPTPGRTRKAKDHGSDCSKKGKGTRSQRLRDLSPKIPSAILDEGPQYKPRPLCKIRRTRLLHFDDKTDFLELTHLDTSKFQTPPRPSIVLPYTHPFGIQRTTARAAPPGTHRLPSSPRTSLG
jgi:hypothetical protein